MSENLLSLDLGRFTRSDVDKLHALRARLRLMHRWFRCERLAGEGGDGMVLYSGDRGPRRYASYRISRAEDGIYALHDHRTGRRLAAARAIDRVIDALPDDFFHAPP